MEEAARWAAQFPRAGISVGAGYNGLTGLDIDTDAPEIIQAVRREFPGETVSKRGSKGLTLFYRYPCGQAPTRIFKDKLGKIIVEILGRGRKTTIPPSIHPDTRKPYSWIDGKGLLSVPFDDLPELPEDFEERLKWALKPWLAEKPSWDEKGALL